MAKTILIITAVLAVIILAVAAVPILQVQQAQRSTIFEGVELYTLEVDDSLLIVPSKISSNIGLIVNTRAPIDLEIEAISYSISIDAQVVGRGTLLDVEIPASTMTSIPISFEVLSSSEISAVLDSVRAQGFTLTVTGVMKVPIKVFGLLKISEILVPYSVEGNVKGLGLIQSEILFDRPSEKVVEGADLEFSGQLVRRDTGEGIGPLLVTISSRELNSPDMILAEGITDNSGQFSFSWKAVVTDPRVRNIEVYATFQGEDRYISTSSAPFGFIVEQSSKISTELTLRSSAQELGQGETVRLTARLIGNNTDEGVPGALIKIFSGSGQLEHIGNGTTGDDGTFAFSWVLPAYEEEMQELVFSARYEGDQTYIESSSKEIRIKVSKPAVAKIRTSLTLVDPPITVTEGDTVQFSGKITRLDTNRGVRSAEVKLFGGSNVLLGSGFSGDDGRFLIFWAAKPLEEGGRSLRIFASFEGSVALEASQSSRFNVQVAENTRRSFTFLEFGQPLENITEQTLFFFIGTLFTGTGSGVTLGGKIINIVDADPGQDQVIVSGFTEDDGSFLIPWNARTTDNDRTFEVYARFDGDVNYQGSRNPVSGHFIMNILPRNDQAVRMTLDEPPPIAGEGSTVIFTGRVVEVVTGFPVPGVEVKIFDSDDDGAELMASGITDREGRFSIQWTAKRMDPSD
ncbi:MAG: hypothetical protein IH932_01980, partial [Thaumarchaeota archaeon]|nr:hypothetical protein [Nitrososphaerota archaeon]